MKTSDLILQQLASTPGKTGRELGTLLSLDKSLVNSELYKLKSAGRVYQDSSYRWFTGSPAKGSARDAATPGPDTPLSRLCRYYLQCLSLDDQGGVSLFAKSKYSPDYIELPEFPGQNGSQAFGAFPGVDKFLRGLQRDTTRRVPFVGYPVRLRKMVSKKGWEGFMVEPVFLFELDEQRARGGDPDLTEEPPILNAKVLGRHAMGGEQAVMEESARIAEELGLTGTGMPELDDVMLRLHGEVCPEWDWMETPDPAQLSSGRPLSDIPEEGIYNRAILLSCERSPYTKGLEQELVKLQQVSESQLQRTALSAWLSRDFSAFQAPPPAQGVLLEPLPLNSEQKEAVEKALTRPLTVITGPPGTGKSQVVSSILINAAHRGRTVLFASKNNKAVDVVETRVNNLGPRPILLRLGRGEYQANLLEYMTGLLAGKASDHERLSYDEAQRDYLKISGQIQDLQRRSEQVIATRNEVDTAESEIESIRQELGEDLFARVASLDLSKLATMAAQLEAAAQGAFKPHQPWLQRLFWRWVVQGRLEVLRQRAEAAAPSLRSSEVPCPSTVTGEASVPEWLQAGTRLKARIPLMAKSRRYQELLNALMKGERIEDLSREMADRLGRVPEYSRRVWETWLRLAPSRLSAEDRKTLGDFCSVLRLLSQSDENGTSAGREVFAQYYRLYPKLLNQLPCWAVTSLSARGRVPFEPGFFDLLVVDEASQCDIASLLPLLYRAKSVVIIGDPKQLKHISAIPIKRDAELLTRYDLFASHPGWGYSSNSAFDLACPMVLEDQVMLKDHHRSHAHIITFSNQYFYGGDLRVATRYDQLKSPERDKPAVRWIHTEGNVTRPGGSSAMNEEEAKAVVRELERIIVHQDYKGSVGVVTPFRAQVNRLRDLVHGHPHSTRLLNSGLLIDTVHRFQGDECDVMLFSPVISKGSPRGAVGFLSSNGNLFNVAVTRARAALVVVGDRKAATSEGVDYLAKFVGFVDGISASGVPEAGARPHPEDFGPAYPKVSRPELVSDWERVFYEALYQAGLRPIPQFDVEKYTLDFALIHGDRRLNIEVDGERYHRAWNGELLRRDQMRNMRMIELGWDVMRFWVYELRDHMPACVERVRRWMKAQ